MTGRLRVLHVVRPAAGGIRRHVLDLIECADRSEVAPSLAAPPEFIGQLPGGLDLSALLPLEIAPRLAPGLDLRAAGRLARFLPAHADLVHAHGLRAAWVAALAHRRSPFPFLFTAHNLVRAGVLTRLALSFIGRRADGVIAITQAVADGLIAGGVPRARIEIIPNGVDLARFARKPPRATARQGLHAPEGAFLVGCIARLSSEKGVDILLRAAGQAPDLTFLIAGDGPERGALARMAPPNARLLGRIDDTRALLGAADVLAVPSRQEGQGIVALEAMAAGVPVVASRIGGLAEMLADGQTALLVPAEDPQALAAALSRLRRDPTLAEQLVKNARALVRERYDVRASVRSVERLYRAMAASV